MFIIYTKYKITQEIPELADLTSLQYLALDRNRLSGDIPDLFGLRQLVVLDLYENKLQGVE